MSAPDLLLDVKGLTVAYGKVEAVCGIDLKVPPGQIVTVIGPNGAGKSTLLNALMGLLPSRGAIRYGGKEVSAEGVEARVCAGLCLVPERRELFAQMSVSDNLLLGGYSRRHVRDDSRAQDLETLYGLFPRLRERRAQAAGTLSGGERQMLALARALMARPKLLMLDEPSLGLAPRIVREVLDAVAALRDRGMSVLLVEQKCPRRAERGGLRLCARNGRRGAGRPRQGGGRRPQGDRDLYRPRPQAGGTPARRSAGRGAAAAAGLIAGRSHMAAAPRAGGFPGAGAEEAGENRPGPAGPPRRRCPPGDGW